MSKFKIYLAGKMAGLTYEKMNSWRVKAEILFNDYDSNVHIINPCNYYNFTLNPNTYVEKEVKEFDLHMVKNSNIVLVNLENPDTIGTAIEIHMAHDEWKIPVIAYGRTEERKVHPWMDLSITKECKTLYEAVDYIMAFYYPNR